MSENQLPIPDFLDNDEATCAAAEAVVAGSGGLLKPPANAKTSKDDKGNVYERWTEGSVIEAVWREGSKAEKPEDQLLIAVVQLKVRAGFPNQHERTWTRYFLSPQIMAKKSPSKPGHTNMHERSLGAISSLLAATGFKPKSGGLTGKLLNHMFPAGKGMGSSPITGKDVMVNFCNQPNKGGKTDRQTHADSFLPYAPAAVESEVK